MTFSGFSWPRADELPAERWRLLAELPGPTTATAWRPEPLRVWEAVGQDTTGS